MTDPAPLHRCPRCDAPIRPGVWPETHCSATCAELDRAEKRQPAKLPRTMRILPNGKVILI
jgi:predicted nucleic acid-binding Zn ribbon protein